METRSLSVEELMPIYYMWKCVEKRNRIINEDNKEHNKMVIFTWENIDTVGKYSPNYISNYLSHMNHK